MYRGFSHRTSRISPRSLDWSSVTSGSDLLRSSKTTLYPQQATATQCHTSIKSMPENEATSGESNAPTLDYRSAALRGLPEPPHDVSSSTDSRHTRDLSAHFFESASLRDIYKDEKEATGQKHRRMFSNDASNPPVAHRRVNSRGASHAVKRHTRQDSAGLDMLSATATEMSPWEPPRDAPKKPMTLQATAMPYYPPPQPDAYPYYPTQSYTSAALQYPTQHSRGASKYGYNPSTTNMPPPSSNMQTPHWQHQSSQTHLTTMDGSDSRVLHPSGSTQDASTNTQGHHRQMSSFSTFLHETMFPPTPSAPEKPKHHRNTSSSVSFDLGMDTTDEAFLRNLQASNQQFCQPVAPPAVAAPVPPVASDSKLAQGGTSKRVRRKCSIEGCTNRVVQGGKCIAHGAKRKLCKHPGCTKHVKKAGLCSAHGPARKRCEIEGCEKVAVQGGRCIAHGAKKKLCSVEGCEKQAILSGMCKKHHDQEASRQAREEKSMEKPTHQRGLSIFNELGADGLQRLLNEENE